MLFTKIVLTKIALTEARKIIKDIQMRKVPRRLDEECFSPMDKENDIVALTGKLNYRLLEKTIQKKMIDQFHLDDRDFFLTTRVSHRGMDSEDPMKRVLFFDSKCNNRPTTACRQWLSLKVPESPVSWTIGLYVPRDKPSVKASDVRKAFDKVLVDCSIRSHSEMQRLRELKQLGLTQLVYPSATHTRFVHSLGAYWLAYKFTDSLRRGFESLKITSADHLCVSVAALCHDLGHGPLSHLFDGEFRHEIGGNIPKHEDLSCQLIRRIFEKEHVRAAFEPYFGAGEEWDRNILFITELVHSTKFKDGKWQPKGRPIEKSFLYDLVSNDNDSIDVDKWDYLLRDSLNTGVAIALNRNSIDRIIENSLVLFDDEKKIFRIGYNKKIAETILQVGQARQQLHEAVYQHKLIKAIESMVVRSLILASTNLKFEGDDGQWYPLSRVTENLVAYLKTNDSVLSQIVYSSGDELTEARKIVEEIQMRKVSRRLDEECFSPVDKENVIVALTGKLNYRLLEKTVQKKMIDQFHLDDRDFFLTTRVSHRGMDSEDPMKRVLFFDSKCTNRPTTACRQWLSLKVPESPVSWTIGLYVPRDKPSIKASDVRKAFDKILVDCSIRGHSSDPAPLDMTPWK